jgi:MOSC domain-containing protein YiiM
VRSLRDRLVDVPHVGHVTWIGVRPEHGAPLAPQLHAELLAGLGLAGDVAARGRAGGKRQVTLIQAEHLPVIAALTGEVEVTPQQVRRNLVVAGVNLLALVRLRFAVGEEVILVGTGACAPCAKMDETVAPGGFQAMRGHGGITASIERGGTIRVGDAVRALGPAS